MPPKSSAKSRSKNSTQKPKQRGESKSKETKTSISSENRLEAMLGETEKELASLQPIIERLEKQLQQLQELKTTKQKLITLKLSLKSILSNFGLSQSGQSTTSFTAETLLNPSFLNSLNANNNLFRANPAVQASEAFRNTTNASFYPDQAFAKAEVLLKRKTSINYEIFRAIVFSGGVATTEQIKHFLVEHQIMQPGNQQPFDDVALTDISSRVNYLVRKGLVITDGRGAFKLTIGWEGN